MAAGPLSLVRHDGAIILLQASASERTVDGIHLECTYEKQPHTPPAWMIFWTLSLRKHLSGGMWRHNVAPGGGIDCIQHTVRQHQQQRPRCLTRLKFAALNFAF